MEFQLLNENNIEATSFENFPYRWGLIKNVLHTSQQQLLLDSFPQNDFQLIQKEVEEKSYAMYLRSGVRKGSPTIYNPSSLAEIWISLLNEISTEKYRNLISAITRIPLDNSALEINFWRYSAGSFLDVHIDKKEKLVTHLIYFNEHWDPNWGGCFRIHINENNRSVYRKLHPTLDNSILLINGEKAWHSVEPVCCNTSASRNGLQVIFWKM